MMTQQCIKLLITTSWNLQLRVSSTYARTPVSCTNKGTSDLESSLNYHRWQKGIDVNASLRTRIWKDGMKKVLGRGCGMREASGNRGFHFLPGPAITYATVTTGRSVPTTRGLLPCGRWWNLRQLDSRPTVCSSSLWALHAHTPVRSLQWGQ